MPRWLRITLISAGSLLVVVIILWFVLALVVRGRKAEILAEITAQLSDRISGNLEIQDMEPSLIRSFPNISVTLKNVSLKDSMYATHKHALLDVREVYVKVSTFALLRKTVDVKQVSLKDGKIFLYTDGSGFSNTYLLKGKEPHKPATGNSSTIRRIILENVRFTLENHIKLKRYNLDIRRLRAEMDFDNTGWQAQVNLETRIDDLQFNTTKGSYAKQKLLKADIGVQFMRSNKTLRIPPQDFRFDGQPVRIGAEFNFSQQPALFAIAIHANQIPFRAATSLVTPNIATKLDSIDFTKPLDVTASIAGHMQFRDTPVIKVNWTVKDNVLDGKALTLDAVNFTGEFYNEVVPGLGHNNANSRLTIRQFSALYDSIPVKADTIRVINLEHPVLTGRFKSSFPLTRLTNAIGPELFRFTSGEAMVDLDYAGSWNQKDTIPGYLRGIIQVKDGSFTYVPRNQDFHACQATLDFAGSDLFFRDISLRSGSSSVQMEGSMKNILNLYFAAPEKVQIDWFVRSPLININDFQTFFAKRQKRPTAQQVRKNKQRMGRVMKQLDVVLELSSVNMNLAVDKVRYRQFAASNVKAGLRMDQQGIRLSNVALQAAGGQMNLNGNIRHAGNGDKFTVNADIRSVQVDQLFHAFENFGQTGVTAKNLKGVFSATANVTGNMKEDATVKPHTMYGTVNFTLNKGALVNFEPLMNLSKFVFRKRDMSNITFEKIQNTLDIKGSKIYIHPMLIASSVLNVEVEGVYGIPKGTDIKLRVPLRNPKKDELVTDVDELQKRRKSGIVINLHAVDGEDGKVKMKLGKGDKGE
ncbi:AsmA family protein [Chitinophaga sp. GCM10012297]|uniref:AsmA family protein n=1 Tax=Chitinophaga chungangae TaxID=2821488 RepID=A0ABS3YIB4_9BACT|nr:AsmA family protein [Chitinophaga chungangae]MBO9154421.1 AsmA family protein [Chitinophaga chungangae]